MQNKKLVEIAFDASKALEKNVLYKKNRPAYLVCLLACMLAAKRVWQRKREGVERERDSFVERKHSGPCMHKLGEPG